MNIWEQLDIEPTTDIAQIKSAYARRAKQCHPEEHPEEFKALQSAYKAAVQIAKGHKAMQAYPASASVPGAEKPESVPEEKKPVPMPESVRSFDFSEVDSYGYRERFFRQFRLIAQNPCLRNNQTAWDVFLNQDIFSELGVSADFRLKLVQEICVLPGWRKKTLLYFQHYLEKFHTEENRTADGKWETGLFRFRIKKLLCLHIPFLGRDRFVSDEGKSLQKNILSGFKQTTGRKIDFHNREDVSAYMQFYLAYGEAHESDIGLMHKGVQIRRRRTVVIAILLCCVIMSIVIQREKRRIEEEPYFYYVRELYAPESETFSHKELESLLEDYIRCWRDADSAMDDVMERYETWSNNSAD